MKDISDNIKRFITEHADDIDNNKWKELYIKLSEQYPHSTEIGKFTELMYRANIDLAKYLTELPAFYLYQSNLQEVVIADTIEIINCRAISYCENLELLTLPTSLKYIDSYAFADSFLKYPPYSKIIYKGTKEQWRAISKSPITWNWKTTSVTVKCIDGEVWMSDTDK